MSLAVKKSPRTIKTIQYILSDDVLSFSENPLNVNYALVEFKPGKSFSAMYFSPGTAEFSQQFSQTNAGNTYNVTLSYNYPGEHPDNSDDFNEIAGRKVIIQIIYDDESSRLIGTKVNPIRISPDFKNDNGGTSTKILITGAFSKPCYWYNIE